MTFFVGLDVSQKMTAVCEVDDAGRRLWRGQCPPIPSILWCVGMQEITPTYGSKLHDDAMARAWTPQFWPRSCVP
jgi:hypothetical protein